MTRSLEDPTTLAQRALHWVEQLRDEENASQEQRQAFIEWLQHSPDHVGHVMEELALDEALALVRSARQNDASRASRIDEWIAMARSAATSPANDAESSGRFRAGPLRWGALAASLLLMVCVAPFLTLRDWKGNGSFQEYVTTGAPHTVKLEDGSVMALKPKSFARARFSQTSREVQLVKGEALFDVYHDTKRPFWVTFDVAEAEAVGTRFNVWREGPDVNSDAKVTVVAGVVRVTTRAQEREPFKLAAGQEARIAEGRVEIAQVSDRVSTTESSGTHTAFQRQTLAQIAAAFNQRKHPPRFVVEGRACGRLVSAVLDVDNPGALIELLGRVQDLVVTSTPEVVHIRARGDTKPADADSEKQCTPGEPTAHDAPLRDSSRGTPDDVHLTGRDARPRGVRS